MMIDLGDRTSWEPTIAKIVSRHVPAKVLDSLRRTPAAGMYDDTMQYLDDALLEQSEEPVSWLLPKIQAALSRGFSSLRAFHACKPVSLASYYERGIVPLTRRWLADEAFALFEGTIPLADIEAKVKDADLSIRQGLIWFATNSNELTDTAGHYLIMGPESMNCLWDRDQRRFMESQRRQRKRGIPTLFECAVPLARMESAWKKELTKLLVAQYFKRQSDVPETEEWALEFGFSIRRALGPEFILGHTHPARIYDAHNHGIDFLNPITRCEWCK